MCFLNLVRDYQAVFHLGVTIIAIIFAAGWTYKLFVKRRQKYPHANITHQVEHWPISGDKILLRVIVKISNEGEILLPLVSGFTRVQQMMPWPPELLESIKQGKEFIKEGQAEVEWPLLRQRDLAFEKGEREIEPSETDELLLDFIIDSGTQVVVLYSYLRNERKPKWKWIRIWKQRPEMGWNTTSIYDLRPAVRVSAEVL